MGRLDEALDDLNEAIHLSNESNSTFYYARGIVYGKMDLHTEAVKDYTQVITLTKDKEGRDATERFQALYNRGNAFRLLGNLDASIEDLTEAIKINGTDPHAKNNLGLSYLDNKDFDLALEEFNKAITIQKDSSTLYNNRGLVYYHKHEYE